MSNKKAKLGAIQLSILMIAYVVKPITDRRGTFEYTWYDLQELDIMSIRKTDREKILINEGLDNEIEVDPYEEIFYANKSEAKEELLELNNKALDKFKGMMDDMVHIKNMYEDIIDKTKKNEIYKS